MTESNESSQEASIKDTSITGQLGQAGHNLIQVQGEHSVVIDGDGNVIEYNKITQILEDGAKNCELITTSPYKGLKKFEPEDAPRFFGRDIFLDELESGLEQTNLILLLGASGSGKSSVVRAGLIPRLQKKWGKHFVLLMFTPDRDPFESFYGSLLSRGFSQSEAQVAKVGRVETLTQVVQVLKRPKEFWLIFIDQFEELFTVSDTTKRNDFIRGLVKLSADLEADPQLKIVATMRADFLDQLDPDPANRLANLTQKYRPLITQMQPEELRQAIEKPAKYHGIEFEAKLVEDIVQQVQGRAGYLPLVQYTLDLLWEMEIREGGINEHRTLNISAYRRLGGVQGALKQRMEEIYQALSPAEQLATQRIFLRLVEIGGDTAAETDWKPVRRRTNRTEFSDEIEQVVLNQLIQERLLVSDALITDASQEADIESGAMVDIAHEILLTSWTKLHGWIQENRQAIALRNRLNDDVRQWKKTKSDDELWSGTKLERVVDLRNDLAFNQVLGGFNPAALEFIKASVSLRDQQQREKEAQRERELAQERKARKIAQRFTAVATIGGVLMAGLSVFSGILRRQAVRQAAHAEIRELSAASNALFDSNQGLDAVIQALDAGIKHKKISSDKFDSEIRVLAALQEAVHATQERHRLEGHTDTATVTVFSPNGEFIASGGKDNTVILWRRDGSKIAVLDKHTGPINALSFSSDSQILASASDDKTVRLWKIDGTFIKSLNGHEGKVLDVQFSPPGVGMIASAGDDGKVKLWDMSGNGLGTLEGHSSDVTKVVFSPDGQTIATASTDDTVRLWQKNGKELENIIAPGIVALSFTPSGKSLITISRDGTARFWTRQGALIGVNYNISPNAAIELVSSFSPDGKMLIVIDRWSSQIWRVEEGWLDGDSVQIKGKISRASFSPDEDNQIVATTTDKDNTVTLMSFDGDELQFDEDSRNDGQIQGFCSDENILSVRHDSLESQSSTENIFETSDDINTISTLQLWNLDGSLASSPLNLSDDIDRLVCSNDGNFLAAPTVDSSTMLWNQTGSELEKFDNLVYQGFSPEGQRLLTISKDNKATLWHPNGKKIQDLKGYNDVIIKVVFSPNSKMIALVSRDNTITLWDDGGKLLDTLSGHQDRITHVVFSPNGQTLVSASQDNTVKFWSSNGYLENGNLIKSIEEYSNNQTQLLFSPDSQRLIIFSPGQYYQSENAAKLFTSEGNFKAVLSKDESSSFDVKFSADSQKIAIATSDGLQFWSRDGTLIKALSEGGYITQVVFSPDDQLIATASYGTAQLRDKNGTIIASLTGYGSNNYINLQFSEDRKTLISSTTDSARLWDRNGTLLKEIKRDRPVEDIQDDSKPIPGIVISPDGKTIASVQEDNTIQLWNSGAQSIITLRGSRNTITAVTFSSNGETLATVDKNNVIQLWKTTGERINTRETKLNQVEQVSFNADGIALLVVSGDDVVKVWDRDGTELQSFSGHTDSINDISFSPDGQHLASASDDNTVRLWSLDGSPTLEFNGHKDQVNSVHFSFDGKQLISGGDDKTVKLWNIDGSELPSLEAHKAKVNSVDFSSDGIMMASASDDGTIKLWNRKDGLLKTLKGHSGAVTSVSFVPDSEMLMSTGSNEVILWSPDGTLIRKYGWKSLGRRNKISISPNGQSLLGIGDLYRYPTVLWSLNLETLLEQGCSQVQEYLATNSTIKESADPHLCDGITTAPKPRVTPEILPTPTPIVPPFNKAVNHAQQAAELAQTAKAPEEWGTVANHWQQAITHLQAITPADPKHAIAQQKISEYQKNLQYAQQQAKNGVAE